MAYTLMFLHQLLTGEDQGDQEMPPCVLYFMYVRRQCQVMSVGRVFETGREEFTHNFRISCFTLNTTCSSGHRARNLQELLRKGINRFHYRIHL